MSTRRKPTAAARIRLIIRWSKWFYAKTERWEGELGMELAYLWAAIAAYHTITCLERHSELLRLLQDASVPLSDPIWKYIQVENEAGELKPPCASGNTVTSKRGGP